MLKLILSSLFFLFVPSLIAQETPEFKANKSVYNEAQYLLGLKSYANAIPLFDSCIVKNFRTDTCNYGKALCLINAGKTKEGVIILEQALKINPDYFAACYSLGEACYDLGQYTRSISYYQQAAQLNPKDDKTFVGLASAQLVIGQTMGAELNCQAALKINPYNDEAKRILQSIKRRRTGK